MAEEAELEEELKGEKLIWGYNVVCGTPDVYRRIREEEEQTRFSSRFGGASLDKDGNLRVYTVLRPEVYDLVIPEKKSPLKRLFSFWFR